MGGMRPISSPGASHHNTPSRGGTATGAPTAPTRSPPLAPNTRIARMGQVLLCLPVRVQKDIRVGRHPIRAILASVFLCRGLSGHRAARSAPGPLGRPPGAGQASHSARPNAERMLRGVLRRLFEVSPVTQEFVCRFRDVADFDVHVQRHERILAGGTALVVETVQRDCDVG